jgi:hypothetical protein
VAEQNNGQTNFIRYMSNPKAFTLKKWFYDLLKLNYMAHDAIIERVATSLTTEKDLEDFGKLVGQVYEIGYRKAVEDYREQFEKLGLKVTIVAPQSGEKSGLESEVTQSTK